MPCALIVYVGTLWQAPSAMSFGPGQHPGGFGYLLFELRMWVCGEQDEATAEGGERIAIAIADRCAIIV